MAYSPEDAEIYNRLGFSKNKPIGTQSSEDDTAIYKRLGFIPEEPSTLDKAKDLTKDVAKFAGGSYAADILKTADDVDKINPLTKITDVITEKVAGKDLFKKMQDEKSSAMKDARTSAETMRDEGLRDSPIIGAHPDLSNRIFGKKDPNEPKPTEVWDKLYRLERGALRGGVEMLEPMLSIGGAATLAPTLIPGPIGKTAAASFIPGLAEGAVTESKKAYKSLKKQDYDEAGSAAGKALGSGLFATGIAKHALGGKAPAVVKEDVIPESPKTLDLQVDALKNGNAKAVLITPGEAAPKEVPSRFKQAATDVGTFLFDPLKVSEKTIAAKVADGTHGEILGHVEPKSQKTTQVVTAIKDGTEAKTSVVSPENVPIQAEVLKQQFPDAEIKVGGEELGKEVLQQRVSENKPQNIAPEIVEPKGETKARGLSKSIEQNAIREKLTQGFGDLPEYKTVNFADQAKRAELLIDKEPALAKQIAMGEMQAPNGILPEAVMIGLRNRANKTGDISLIRDLGLASKLTEQASVHGQRISILRQIDPNDPVSVIAEVAKVREEIARKRYGKNFDAEKSRIEKEIHHEIRKASPTKETWASFIESIRC